jgi:hypothetical protein
LGSYGPAAKVAAPKLFLVYTNAMFGTDLKSAHDLGVFLLEALRNIDRDTAAKAEAFIVNGGPLGVLDYGWTVTKLPNGMELIAGGSFQTKIPTIVNHDFARTQLFDPATGKRTETGSMNAPRDGHKAILLNNGKVLVAGGANLGSDGRLHELSSAELYDPNTGKWTETGSMNSPHPNEQAVLQRDGKVRISGYIGDYQKRPNDDLYDPATGTWTEVTNR